MRVRESDFNFPIITIQYDYMAVKTSNVESLLKEQLETKFLKAFCALLFTSYRRAFNFEFSAVYLYAKSSWIEKIMAK